MIHSMLTALDKVSSFKTASAHCDIPCKIYDPSTAQICALTMLRLIDLIEDINAKTAPVSTDRFQLVRLIKEKEEHGIKLKKEINVIWGDYFKQPQIDKYPNIHRLVHNIMMQSSKVKQGVDRDEAIKLIELINDFSTIFWETKDVPTFIAKCPYPPSQAMVYPKLNSI